VNPLGHLALQVVERAGVLTAVYFARDCWDGNREIPIANGSIIQSTSGFGV